MKDDITSWILLFDYYFASYKLMEKLSDNGILGTGTVKENPIIIANQNLLSKNALQKA